MGGEWCIDRKQVVVCGSVRASVYQKVKQEVTLPKSQSAIEPPVQLPVKFAFCTRPQTCSAPAAMSEGLADRSARKALVSSSQVNNVHCCAHAKPRACTRDRMYIEHPVGSRDGSHVPGADVPVELTALHTSTCTRV